MPKKIAISGAHGFIGRHLTAVLLQSNYQVIPMVRKQNTHEHEEIFYDYENNSIDADKLSECYAVIHLAGKNIMSGFWTDKVKQEIYDSRVKSTKLIAKNLARMKNGPKILLNASAIGIYGHQQERELEEDSPLGKDFLAKLCKDWERATLSAKNADVRVVNMRFGHVLDKNGGMLRPLALIYKLGLGGMWGSGKQYMTYVTREELIRQIVFVLENDDVKGPVNMVAKNPITNEIFTRALGLTFHRKPFINIPAFLFSLAQDQGKSLLASIRAYPRVLEDQGFSFSEENIYQSLAKMYAV